MASSTMSTDRRWASSSRKSGMTVLGKVPKPINLPSQRLENNGLDPNVEIVPKGTITWGTRPTSSSSPNAWSTNTNSILSPKPGSPSETGRPVSSGSSPHTRPSTANADKFDVLNTNLSSCSRPNSSSGVFEINRPRSADTRPGSAHLSRFAETSEKLGATPNERGFTLSSGDFPTLGFEKPSEPHRGHSSHGRPTSRDAKPKETLDSPLGHNLHGRPISSSDTDPRPKTPNSGDYMESRAQNVNILKTEDPTNHWYREPPPYQSPNPYQSRPNLNPHVPAPLQYDSSWRVPPPPHEGIWYGPGPHGPGPYRPGGTYPVDPFVYYPPPPPQFRPPPPNPESASRPHMPHNPYLIPTHIPARPGVHAPHTAYAPAAYDTGYYGPPRTGLYGNPNHHHHQNTNHYHNTNNTHNNNHNNQQQQGVLSQYNEKLGSSVDFGQKQYKVLLKHKELKEEEKKDDIVPPAVKSGDHSLETGSEKRNENLKRKDPLIQKIESLNSKMRSLELGKEERVKKQTGESSSVKTGEDAEKKSSEETKVKQEAVPVLVPVPVETSTDAVVKGGNDGMVSEANLDLLDPAEYEIQRLKLKEKAAQRAKELQREEEERICQQKAKALAKLEELNRRANLQKDPSNSANEKPPQEEEPPKQEPSKISNYANLQKEPPIVRNDKDKQPNPQEPLKVSSDSHLQKEPRKITNDKHFQKESRKFPNHKPKVANDANFQKDPSKLTNDKHPQQEPTKVHNNTNLQKEPSKFSNDKPSQQVPTTVTLSFGTISEVQIISHEISVPTTGTVQEMVPVSSHPKDHHNHHNKQTGYKKRHNSNTNNNISSEASINEKSSNVATGTDTHNESHHRKRGNRNPRNKNKSDETAPGEENKEVEKPNSAPSENSGTKPHENPNFHNNRGGGNWKAQSSRRSERNPRLVTDKPHGGETVMWAPVKQSNKTNQSEESTNDQTVNKSETETQTQTNPSVKTKRAEMERYVPKPQLERKLDELTGDVPPPESKTGEDVGTNNRSFKHGNGGKPNASWRQRAVPVEPVLVREEKSTNAEWDVIQLGMTIPDTKDHEGDKKRNYGHKFYKATGNNYSGQGSNSSGSDVNISETGDQSQHWKPKAHHGSYRASNWQKVNHEEGKTVISSQSYHQRGSGRGRNGNLARE